MEYSKKALCFALSENMVQRSPCLKDMFPSFVSEISFLCQIFLCIDQYRHEVDTMDTFENNVATHLTRIMNSSDHSIVISSAR